MQIVLIFRLSALFYDTAHHSNQKMTKSRFTSLSQAVEAYYDELRQFIHQRTGSSLMAEDVIQETWIRARTTSADLPDNPRAYLYRMAGNVAVDHVRRQKNWGREEGDSHETESSNEHLDQLPGHTPDLIDAIISQQELAILDAAIRELPDKCREVFLLYRGHGLSMREIAIYLSISEKTVEKHVARAMLHCRQRLRDAGRNV